ncbi:MAG: hypothetical protein SNJ72_01955 [Fimbriimonadales bacterium]
MMERTLSVSVNRWWLYVALLLPGSASLLRGQVIRAILWLGICLLLWGLLLGSYFIAYYFDTAPPLAIALLIVHLLHWRNAVNAFLADGQPLSEWLNQRPNMAISALTLGTITLLISASLLFNLALVLLNILLDPRYSGFSTNTLLTLSGYTPFGLIAALAGIGGFLAMRWGWHQERLHLQHLRERALVETAQAHGGTVSVSEVVASTGLSFAEAKEMLDELASQRLIERLSTEGGQVLYRVFPSNG